MNKPLVSIIMPAYNAEKYLGDAIQSVIGQTIHNWELFIVNDGSTDNTAAIAEEYAARDTRINFISQQNKKQGAARNAGITKSSGEWIAFLDADDLWTPGKLEKQLETARLYPAVDVIFSKGYIFSNDTDKAVEYSSISGLFEARKMYKLEYEGNYIPVLSVLLKATYVHQIGLQDEESNIQGCEDWDYWLRLAKNGATFFGMDDYLFYYRRHATNVSNNNDKMLLAKAVAFTKNLNPEWLTHNELAKVISFLNITICSFIKKGSKKEAIFLNKQLNTILKKKFRLFCNYLIRVLGAKSYYPVRLIFKIGSLLTVRG